MFISISLQAALAFQRTITSKRNGTLFSAKQNFGWQLWICSRGQGGWKAVIGQTPRNAQVTKAYWSPLHENIQSCQPKSGFPQKRVPFLLLMIVLLEDKLFALEKLPLVLFTLYHSKNIEKRGVVKR